MCGICGFVGSGEPGDLGRMNARLAHRGPDGEGFYRDPESRVFLGHKRLAIIDLAGGGQPMSTPDGQLTVVFNGEIYNHQQLRAELERAGHVFFTDHCDTEVLLHGYRQWGADLPKKLSGMWAFALHDKAKARLFLSRDPFGKKPLYYLQGKDFFAFASEPASLGAKAGVNLALSFNGLRKYLAYGFLPGEQSIYRGVRRLKAGCSLELGLPELSLKVSRHFEFKIEPFESLPSNPEAVWGEQLRTLIERAVKRRLMSDVPLGVFLSGGIDSSCVTAYAAKHCGGRLQTFSIGFGEASFDESEYAALVAQTFKTEHHPGLLDPEKSRELLDELTCKLDEPLADSSLWPTYLLCRETRKVVTVALGGDGADELFAGYDPFKALAAAELYARLCPKPLHRALGLMAARLPVRHSNMHLSFKIRRFLGGLNYPAKLWNPVWLGPLSPKEIAEFTAEPVNPEELYSEAIDCYESCASRSIVDKTLEFYTKLYLTDDILVKVDRASMANSLEVRAPFLDRELVDFARRIPHAYKFRHGQGKYILKKALSGVLPARIIERPKKGFGAPLGQWFGQGRLGLGDLSQDRAPGNAYAAKRLAEHLAGRADNRLFLWSYWLLQRLGLCGSGQAA